MLKLIILILPIFANIKTADLNIKFLRYILKNNRLVAKETRPRLTTEEITKLPLYEFFTRPTSIGKKKFILVGPSKDVIDIFRKNNYNHIREGKDILFWHNDNNNLYILHNCKFK